MTAPDRAKIVEQIFPEGSPLHLYAILDGARDPRIHAMVTSAQGEQACLYAGKLPKELVEVAPYLVKLAPRDALTKTLLSDGWGRSWGIFVLATATLEELRRHFRRFLKVQDPQGKTLIFRYYDPRVLRVYLPTCQASEIAGFFGPASLFVLEGEAPETLLRYHRDGDRLGTTEVALS